MYIHFSGCHSLFLVRLVRSFALALAPSGSPRGLRFPENLKPEKRSTCTLVPVCGWPYRLTFDVPENRSSFLRVVVHVCETRARKVHSTRADALYFIIFVNVTRVRADSVRERERERVVVSSLPARKVCTLLTRYRAIGISSARTINSIAQAKRRPS